MYVANITPYVRVQGGIYVRMYVANITPYVRVQGSPGLSSLRMLGGIHAHTEFPVPLLSLFTGHAIHPPSLDIPDLYVFSGHAATAEKQW